MSAAGMAEDLRLLNDVLATTPLADRYWLFGGLVLGWARERALLGHDCVDADLALLDTDVDRLEAAFDALFAAGFEPLYCFPGARRTPTEYSFKRGERKFDFFLFELDGDRFRYRNYALHGGRGPVMNVCEIPAQPLTEVAFLGRRWLKMVDSDVELTAQYGDWRTPDPDWDYLDGPATVSTHRWDPRGFAWNGEPRSIPMPA